MAFERITEDDLQGKGNLGRPDTPGVDTTEIADGEQYELVCTAA